MGWTHHEVGKVDVGRMANILQLARECGFSVPLSRPPPPRLGAAAATPVLSRLADDGVGAPRGTKTIAGGDTPGGLEGVRSPGRGGVEKSRCLKGGGGRQACLPRPDGMSVPAPGSSYGSSCVWVGGLSPHPHPHPPLAGGSDAACDRDVVLGAGGGVEATCEVRGQKEQGQEEEEEQGQSENSKCWTTVSQRTSSVTAQAGGKHGGDFAGAGATQASGVGVLGERAGIANGRSSEGAQLQRQLPPAHCRVVVIGAGASGLSAAACLRARGEDGVVVLERWGWLSIENKHVLPPI